MRTCGSLVAKIVTFTRQNGFASLAVLALAVDEVVTNSVRTTTRSCLTVVDQRLISILLIRSVNDSLISEMCCSKPLTVRFLLRRSHHPPAFSFSPVPLFTPRSNAYDPMLPRFLSVILVIGIQVIFVVGQEFAPQEILAAKDPDTVLQPLAGRPADEDMNEASDNPKVIRGLLVARQDGCPNNYAFCND